MSRRSSSVTYGPSGGSVSLPPGTAELALVNTDGALVRSGVTLPLPTSDEDTHITLSHQGLALTAGGTGRSANADHGGCVILFPSTTLNQWVEARGYFGAGSASTPWQGMAYVRNNRPWVFRTYLSIPITAALTSLVVLYGAPAAIATPATLNGGTSQGFGIRANYAGGQYTLSALSRRAADSGTVSTGSLTVPADDNHRLAIKIAHDGAGTLRYYAHTGGVWSLIATVTGFGTGTGVADRYEGVIAVQATNTGGSSTDSQWVWYKHTCLHDLISI